MTTTATTPNQFLIRGAQVFDGTSQQLIDGKDVLVRDGKIAGFARGITAEDGVVTLDADGRTLMPGLVDAHYHSMFNFWPISKVLNSDFGLLCIVASQMARETLLRGFTTVTCDCRQSVPNSRMTHPQGTALRRDSSTIRREVRDKRRSRAVGRPGS